MYYRVEGDMNQTNKKIAVLLTAYNEEKNLPSILKEISGDYSIYVIDDGSSDQTRVVSLAHGCRVVSHPINLGQGMTAVTGYKVIIKDGFDIIVKMDADGQHDPREIPLLIRKIEESDCDIVVGSRRLGSNYASAPFFRKTFLPVYTWIINRLTGYHMTDAMSGFRCFKAKTLKNIEKILDDMIEPQYLASEMFVRFAKAGLTVTEVPINMRERKSGSSYKGFVRYGWGALWAIIQTLLDKEFMSISNKK